jgi:hypothetical protein
VIISIEKKVQPPKDRKTKTIFLEVNGRGEDPPPDSISLRLFS